jgi:hypothetical protein
MIVDLLMQELAKVEILGNRRSQPGTLRVVRLGHVSMAHTDSNVERLVYRRRLLLYFSNLA